jgi:hypothetical protein
VHKSLFIPQKKIEDAFDDGVLHEFVYEGVVLFFGSSVPTLLVSFFLTSYGFKTISSWKKIHFCRFSEFCRAKLDAVS